MKSNLVFIAQLMLWSVPVEGFMSSGPRGFHRVKRVAAITLQPSPTSAMPDFSQEITDEKPFLVVPEFLPGNTCAALRKEIKDLRAGGKFSVAGIGEDATHDRVNTDIRVAETLFVFPNKVPGMEPLYGILEAVRQSLPGSLSAPLTECLLAYYPEGGYYKKHLDSVQNSASVLREFSFLIYLNPSWSQEDGGCLRIFKDPAGLDDSDYVDVEPRDGTLVVFKSGSVYHEVLPTKAERTAIVGWYNRPPTVGDIGQLSSNGSGVDATKIPLLLVSAALVAAGVAIMTQA